MNNLVFKSECGPDKGPLLAITEDGKLYRRENRDSEWEFFDFNGMYAGYFPECTFTALEYTGSFWLGGISQDSPILYSSLMGGVWMERNIEMHSPEGGTVLPEGKILRILWDSINRQLHLVMSSGQLITLPDCQKCVRIRKIADNVCGGRLEGRDCILTLGDGTELRTPLDDLTQLRVSWSWANAHISDGGTVIDLRTELEYENGPLPWDALNMDTGESWNWLEEQPKDAWVFIACARGLNSDVLTKLAREAGFINVWSLGGTDEGFHVN